MIAVTYCDHGEVEESGECMAIVVQKGDVAYVQLTAYESEVLRAHQRNDLIRSAQECRHPVEASTLCRTICEFLEGKTISERRKWLWFI
jgi:hypothetical protein